MQHQVREIEPGGDLATSASRQRSESSPGALNPLSGCMAGVDSVCSGVTRAGGSAALDEPKVQLNVGMCSNVAVHRERAMARLPRIVAAGEVVCVIVEQVWHVAWLPLGGSRCAQLGILLGAAFVLNELLETLSPSRR